MKKIKIISDGTRQGTKVLDAETGKLIEHVTKVTVILDPVEGNRAVMEVVAFNPEIEITTYVREKEV